MQSLADVSTALSPLPATGHAFLVGQDEAGHWVAIETHGLGGGLFTSRTAALAYARAETNGRDGAILLTGTPMSLDPV